MLDELWYGGGTATSRYFRDHPRRRISFRDRPAMKNSREPPLIVELRPFPTLTSSTFGWHDRAGKTGFEPATSGVTDQHSNRLSYFPLSSLL